MDIQQEKEDYFRKGLAMQREQFKRGKDGSGTNNYDQMCDAIENIKSEIKHKCTKQGNTDSIKKVEKIIHWFRTIELKYTKPSPHGKVLKLPPGIDIKINNYLTEAYETLVGQMDILGLL